MPPSYTMLWWVLPQHALSGTAPTPRWHQAQGYRHHEELYRRYARRLKGFFYRQLGGDENLADDATHMFF